MSLIIAIDLFAQCSTRIPKTTVSNMTFANHFQDRDLQIELKVI